MGKGMHMYIPYIQFTNVISAAVEKTQQIASTFRRMSGSLFQKIPNQHTKKANKQNWKKKKKKKRRKRREKNKEKHRQTKQMIKITSLLLLFQNVSLRTTEEVHWGRVMLIVI